MRKTLIEKVTIAVYEANSYGSSLSEDEVEAAIRAVLQEMLLSESRALMRIIRESISEIAMPDELWSRAIEQFAKENGIEL